MKILINGYHFGNNTPPYVRRFNELGHATKLITAARFDTDDLLLLHRLSPDLQRADLLQPSYGTGEKMLIRLLRKIHLPGWRQIQAQKVRAVLDHFQPDVVWNHSLWIDTDVMIYTGFHPQVTVSYGYNEIQNHPERRFIRRIIYRNTDRFIDALPDFREYLIAHEGVDRKKFPEETIYLGLPNLNALLASREAQVKVMRERFGIPYSIPLIVETRGLRQSDGGAIDALRALHYLRSKGAQAFLILLSGILGNPSVLKEAEALIASLGLRDCVRIVAEEISYDDVLSLYAAAEINLSLLPSDALGKSIMEAVTQRCLLVLTDLPDYRTAFGEHAEYVKPGDWRAIADAINRALQLPPEQKRERLDATLQWVTDHQDFDKACERILQYFAITIEEYRRFTQKGRHV